MYINKINRDGSNSQNPSGKRKKKKKENQDSPKALSESIEISYVDEDANLEQNSIKKPSPKSNTIRKSIDIKA